LGQQRPRRKFTQEYKLEVVRLVKQGDKSIGQIALELDLTESAVRNWVKRHDAEHGDGPDGQLTESERAELRRLRLENQRLRLEREILKKAAAFFANESN
jgi:transposase